MDFLRSQYVIFEPVRIILTEDEHIIILLFKNTIKLENCLLQVECKRGPERTISDSKFSNIASIYLKIETRLHSGKIH